MFLSREPFLDGYMHNQPTRAASLPNVSFQPGGRLSLRYSPVSCQDHCWQLTNDQEGEKRVLFANQRQIARGKRKVALDALFENLLRKNGYNMSEGSRNRKHAEVPSIPCEQRSELRD